MRNTSSVSSSNEVKSVADSEILPLITEMVLRELELNVSTCRSSASGAKSKSNKSFLREASPKTMLSLRPGKPVLSRLSSIESILWRFGEMPSCCSDASLAIREPPKSKSP